MDEETDPPRSSGWATISLAGYRAVGIDVWVINLGHEADLGDQSAPSVQIAGQILDIGKKKEHVRNEINIPTRILEAYGEYWN